MHELAIAHALLDEAGRVVALHGEAAIDRIVVRVGALAGVEAPLLARAFEMARAGTLASSAELVLEPGPIEVACRSCGGGGGAAPGRLTCPKCGDWRVDVVAGDELLLLRLEFAVGSGAAAAQDTGETATQSIRRT